MADPIPFSFKCDARWDDMLGSGGKRLCTQCNTPVVDLSSLTREEAAKVLATPGVCVNYIVEDGEVVYGRKARGGVDPEGPVVREASRRRGRGRRLLRWASAAASVAAAGGLAVPGIASAGTAAAEDEGGLQRLRDWVASWFEEVPTVEPIVAPIPEPLRLGGAPMPVQPEPPVPVDTGVVEHPEPPPRRHGGRPKPPPPQARVSVSLGDLDVASVEVTCRSSRARSPLVAGRAEVMVGVDWEPQECTVRLPTDPPQQATVELKRNGVARCTMEERGLRCQ